MNNILIEINKDKEPYIKELTKDKIINLTGESGSGKSHYTNKYKDNDNYVIIDTDEVFARYNTSTGYNKELGDMFRSKYKVLPSLFENFDLIYDEIINYFKNSNKTIIIDSAQFRNLKDFSKIKGTVIVMRTSVDKCYQRCIERYKKNNPEITKEDFEKYSNKKKQIYNWYNSLNDFIIKIDQYNCKK